MIAPALPTPSTGNAPRLRGLWLTRELPFPLDSGDKIYSAFLLKSLAEAGVDLTVVGLRPDDQHEIPTDWPVQWQIVPGRRKSQVRSLFSMRPLVAESYATAAYRELLTSLAGSRWDFVVFDQYGTGWAVPYFLRSPRGAPLLVHVAHDHEASVCGSLYRHFDGSRLKRLALWMNYLKVRRFEGQLVSAMDLVTAITEEDERLFNREADTASVVLKPGYLGIESTRTRMTEAIPRRVIMIGSFRWIAKEENLRRFIAVADPVFQEHGIELDVVGAMPQRLRDELNATVRAVRLHGFVDDVGELMRNARLAVVPETIGGGFKLKFLDYIFNRVPIASIRDATSGLPLALRAQILSYDSIPALVAGIVQSIDDLPLLNGLQEGALTVAQRLFRWSDRGSALREAILREIHSPAMPATELNPRVL